MLPMIFQHCPRNQDKAVGNAMEKAWLLAVIVLVVMACWVMPVAVQARQAAAELTWEPVVALDRQLFPSLIVSTATMASSEEDEGTEYFIGDPDGFIGAVVADAPAGSKVKLVVKGNRLMSQSSVQGEIAEPEEAYDIFPKINWHYDALLKSRQVRPMSVVMELFINGKSLGIKSETVTVRSLNDCPIYLMPTDKDGNPVEDESKAAEPGVDMSWMFAAYVNENHPWVDQILKEALQSGEIDAFTGYQSGDPNVVLRQVFAIWNVMQRRGMKYSSITTPSAVSPAIYAQHVRLFGDSLNAQQTNCIDGTVLFASICRKIDILSYLVLIPGHAFFAFSLDPDQNRVVGLETTMMGDVDLAQYKSKKLTPEQLGKKIHTASWNSFVKALKAGTAELEKSANRFQSEKPADAEYQLISVDQARNMGILPLASD